MSLENFPDIFSLLTGSLWINIFLFTFILFYSVFALIALRQTQLMSKILNESSFSPFLKLVAALHFIAAVATLFLAIILFLP